MPTKKGTGDQTLEKKHRVPLSARGSLSPLSYKRPRWEKKKKKRTRKKFADPAAGKDKCAYTLSEKGGFSTLMGRGQTTAQRFGKGNGGYG